VNFAYGKNIYGFGWNALDVKWSMSARSDKKRELSVLCGVLHFLLICAEQREKVNVGVGSFLCKIFKIVLEIHRVLC